MVELGFEKGFNSVPLYLDNTSTLHVAGNRTYSPRAKHIALRYFFVQELVEEGMITIHYVNTQDQLADLGTKHLGKHRHLALIKLINDFKARTTMNAGLPSYIFSCTFIVHYVFSRFRSLFFVFVFFFVCLFS